MSLESDFNTGGAGLITMDESTLIIGVIATLMLLWTAWLSVTAYREYGVGKLDTFGLMFSMVRGIFLLTVLLYLITW